MIYKRGNSLWYKFRFTTKNEDGSKNDFMVRRPAKVRNRKDAKDVEREHRRALSLGQLHPNDPWPMPTSSAPPVFRAFAQEFLQYAKTHTKAGTHTFYSVCLERLLTFAAIADAPLDAITGETVNRYARYRREVPENSVVTVNGDLRTLRRILHLAEEWGKLDRAPAVHELPQPQGRDRVLSFTEEAKYLAKASENLRDAAILAVDTGLRPNSELFPLKWADVDLTERPESPCGVLHVRQGKTDSAQRSLPLTPRAARLQRRKRAAEAKVSAFVFPGAGVRDTLRRCSTRTKQQSKIRALRALNSIAGVIPSEPAPHSLAWTATPWHGSWDTVRLPSRPGITSTSRRHTLPLASVNSWSTRPAMWQRDWLPPSPPQRTKFSEICNTVAHPVAQKMQNMLQVIHSAR